MASVPVLSARRVAGLPTHERYPVSDEPNKADPTRRPRRRATRPPATRSTASYPALGPILDLEDLASLPKPEPLIEGWLDLRTVLVMPGDTGTNKTFVAVGWACSIATGTPWLGHEVCIDPATVVMVVGEGEHGLTARIRAWQSEHGVTVPQHSIQTIVRPKIDGDDGPFWEELTKLCQKEGARFVVFDTLSSLIPTVDETKEAAMVVAALHRLVAAINGTAALLHHTGWNNPGRSRGGAQFEQNSDAVIVLQKTDTKNPESSPVELWRKKVKDGPSGTKMYVERVAVADSCVLKEVVGAETRKGAGRLTGSDITSAILRLLDAEPLIHTTNTAEKQLMRDLGDATNRTTLRRAWAEAEQAGLIHTRSAKGTEGKTRDRWERVPAEDVPPASYGEVDGEVETGSGNLAAEPRRRSSRRRG